MLCEAGKKGDCGVRLDVGGRDDHVKCGHVTDLVRSRQEIENKRPDFGKGPGLLLVSRGYEGGGALLHLLAYNGIEGGGVSQADGGKQIDTSLETFGFRAIAQLQKSPEDGDAFAGAGERDRHCQDSGDASRLRYATSSGHRAGELLRSIP
ncbi:hypothetical protein [Streptomyces sp. NBC_01589]|uniref:hypothetical protein n=1 Tax=unclassified Streptomyces TaxID=2593676 RepID=UPI003864FB7F